MALELGQHEVLLKATDNPEIIVREHDIFVTVTSPTARPSTPPVRPSGGRAGGFDMFAPNGIAGLTQLVDY